MLGQSGHKSAVGCSCHTPDNGRQTGVFEEGRRLQTLSLFGARPPKTVDLGHEFALVDVETTGLSARSDRIVQIAVRQLDRFGATQQTWHSLINPVCDPGPTFIHGITSQMLLGAPSFDAVAPVITRLLAGRVFVAHNATFDWGFLQAESLRSVATLDCTQRLCTLALARRLDLNVPDFKLGTLAGWADIRQQRAHSADDDTRVLEAIFLKLVRQAIVGGVTLPMSSNTAAVQPWVQRAPAVSSPWQPCSRWDGAMPLMQGMKFVVTGRTGVARTEIYQRGIIAGLVPMNTVGAKTNTVVCNESGSGTAKASRAAQFSVPVITEDRFLTLLLTVLPGTPLSERRPVLWVAAPVVTGPLTGCRVLVLGGPHDRASAERAVAGPCDRSRVRGAARRVRHPARRGRRLTMPGVQLARDRFAACRSHHRKHAAPPAFLITR